MKTKNKKNNVLSFPAKHQDIEDGNENLPVDFSKFPQIRNREETRALEKVLRKSGKTKNEIEGILELSKIITKAFDSENDIGYKQSLDEGEMVKLNIDKMWSYPDWDNRQESYKEYGATRMIVEARQ